MKYLATVFAILGFATSVLNGIALIFASNAQRRLLQWWHLAKPKDYSGPGVMGCEPIDKKMYGFYFTPWIQLAFIFSIGWLTILYYVSILP
jgi:hypothetical protein